MPKFVAIEGLDGAGKSTQVKLLASYFDAHKIKYRYLHFPRTGSGIYGEMVASFLRGEFGSVNDVNPYLVALIYAGDRNDAKAQLKNWIKNDYVLLIDRYVYSNIAFQCAKIQDFENKLKLQDWILQFEYVHNKIPKPVISIYLDVDFSTIRSRLKIVRTGSERDYLNENIDIHENSLDLQRSVKHEYSRLVSYFNDFISIDCLDNEGILLTEEKINDKILNVLKENRIIDAK